MEAFSAREGDASVYVEIDDDLLLKFRRADVAVGNTGDSRIRIAMILGLDDDETDLIVVNSPGHGLERALHAVETAVQRALAGFPSGSQ